MHSTLCIPLIETYRNSVHPVLEDRTENLAELGHRSLVLGHHIEDWVAVGHRIVLPVMERHTELMGSTEAVDRIEMMVCLVVGADHIEMMAVVRNQHRQPHLHLHRIHLAEHHSSDWAAVVLALQMEASNSVMEYWMGMALMTKLNYSSKLSNENQCEKQNAV